MSARKEKAIESFGFIKPKGSFRPKYVKNTDYERAPRLGCAYGLKN
jgi:hypothetical protein